MHVLAGVDGRGEVPVIDGDAAVSILDERELARWARIRHPADREAFAVAHATLRWVVAERLGRSLSEVVIDTTESGRPVVRDADAQVSLSRRRGVVAVAVHDAPVGVDVERCPPGVDTTAVARRFFAPDEADAVAAAADPGRVFCRLWVRKEALAKALDLPLEVALAVRADDSIAIAPSDASMDPRHVLLRDLPCPTGFAAASAVVMSGAGFGLRGG